MPVTHLGLTVSDVTCATDFYLAALRPLGYRCIGRRGDSNGLGVQEADLFLCREPNGKLPSPTHVAFRADDSEAVRNCYAAALGAGARPNGAPDHREGSDSDGDGESGGCFNAAVLDPDGHTLEFIFRQSDDTSHAGTVRSTHAAPSPHAIPAASQGSGSVAFGKRCQPSATPDLINRSNESIPRAQRSPPPPASNAQLRKGKGFVETLISAAAGAAFAYAVHADDHSRASPTAERPATADRKPAHSSAGSVRHKAFDDRSRRSVEPPSTSHPPPPARSQTYDTRARPSVHGSQPGIRRTWTLPGEIERGSPASLRQPAATRRPPSRHDSAFSIPSRPSRRPSDAGANRPPLGPSHSDRASRPPPSQPRTQASARSRPPASISRFNARRANTSDGKVPMDDLETVVPDDSISCANFTRPRERDRRGADNHVRRSSAGRGDGNHERGRRGTMMAMPFRPRARSGQHSSSRR